MKFLLQTLLVTILISATANGQDTSCRVTCTNSCNLYYVDGVQVPIGSNAGNWQQPDSFNVSDNTRLIAIRGNNVIGGCSGIMVAIVDHPSGYVPLSDRTWKCSAAAENNWMSLEFNDSHWEDAHEVAQNGQIINGCPWIPVQGMPGGAFWIWTSEIDHTDMVVSCRGRTPVCNQYNPCQNNGTCNLSGPRVCTCPIRTTGLLCETDINECDSNPCQRGGECRLDDVGYHCLCGVLTTGVHCETDLSDCNSSPCQNAGTCTFDVTGGYTCTCVPGYTGINCQTDIDECASQPCLNGATCRDLINAVNCTCAPGFQGNMCQININECASNPCLNGGTCNDGINGYNCSCHSGHTGTHCETGIGLCAVNPCQNGGTCTLGGPDGFTCLCDSSWDGNLCQENLDRCASNPCRNGGTCVTGVSSYTCNCTAIFEGTNCEALIPGCGSVMQQSVYPPSRGFWVMCEINVIDHGAAALNTPCSQLLVGMPHYGNASNIIASGGYFGCFPTKFPNEMSDGACVPGYNNNVVLATCLSCTHMGVCIFVNNP